MPRLHVTLPDGSEVTHDLTDDVITLGRVEDNQIQIEDASVSSHHAELSLRGANYSLRDLGSTNGTTINGASVEPEAENNLAPGDRIVFGSISVRYLTEASTGTEHLQPLPAEADMALAPASTSAAPSNFTNASPFQSKKVKKDPANAIVMAVAVVALAAAGFAIYTVLQMKPPM